VEDSPLAVCDARTIRPQDLVATDLRYRDRMGEVYSLLRAHVPPGGRPLAARLSPQRPRL